MHGQAEVQPDDASRAKSLGARLRDERSKAGLSLRALARAVNLSASFVSQIENDKAQPSVSTLYALCQQLGISVDHLFPGPGEVSPVSKSPARTVGQVLAARRTVRDGHALGQGAPRGASEGPVTRAGAGRRIELDSGVSWERLGGSADDAEDYLLVTYDAGGSSSTGGEKLMRHGGHEFGYVMSGRLSVELGFAEYVLEPGDSIAYESSTPHRLFNDGEEPVVALWMVLPGSHPST